jgi:hypothetical protein
MDALHALPLHWHCVLPASATPVVFESGATAACGDLLVAACAGACTADLDDKCLPLFVGGDILAALTCAGTSVALDPELSAAASHVTVHMLATAIPGLVTLWSGGSFRFCSFLGFTSSCSAGQSACGQIYWVDLIDPA